MNKAADAVVGGWRLSVIPTFRGGFPLTLSSNTTTPAPTPSRIGRIA